MSDNTFGFGTDTVGLSATVHDRISKQVIATLRAGLIALPKGAVVPAVLTAQTGENFTLRMTEFPDLEDSAATVPLTEGIAPTAIKLGGDTLDFNVRQVGAHTTISDVSAFQSALKLGNVAVDKIARLAVQVIDNLAMAALLAHPVDLVTGVVLSTVNILDAKAILGSRNVQTIPGVGYYALTNPLALRGLENEDELNGYIDVTAQTDAGALTRGAVFKYRGITFLTSSRILPDASGLYPVVFLGAQSVSFGDVSTIEYVSWSGAGAGNELAQLSGVGFKGILGGKVLAFKETTDGEGTNGAAVDRVYTIAVATGIAS